VIEGPQGASDAQLKDLAQMARQFKAAEGGGGAVPFGSKLTFASPRGGDAVSLLEYCDNCMARVWALMLVQLGMNGGSGNRALGQEFALYAARWQRGMAKWVCRAVNRLLDDYMEYNSAGSNYAPLLHFEQEKPDSLSVAELVAMIEAQALHVDPELEAWLRNEHGLPAAPEPQTDPTLGDLTPEEVALVHNSRNPPALPPGQPGDSTLPKPRNPPAPQDPNLQNQTIAATPPALLGQWQVPLPSRTLRRQPTEIEARSRTDFREMDAAHQTVLADVQALMRDQIIPAQIQAIADQIDSKALTKTAMAGLTAPVLGADDLKARLFEAARQGAHSAAAELAAQGVTATIPSDEELGKLVSDQAQALAEMAANGLSLAAQRRAQSLVGGGRSQTELRTQVQTGLSDMKHQWTMDQLNGAVQLAQNAGRGGTFGTATQEGLRYYASEILDLATCLHPDALVTTERGAVRAADVTLEDRLATHAGRFIAPTAIRVSEVEQELVRINTGATALAVTPDHRLLIVRDGHFGWAAAGEVTVGDLVVSEATAQGVGEARSVDLGFGDAPDGQAARLQAEGLAGVGAGAERVPVIAVGFDDEIAEQEVNDPRADLGLHAVSDVPGFEQLPDAALDTGLGVRGDIAAPGAIAPFSGSARHDPERVAAMSALDQDRRPTASLGAVAAGDRHSGTEGGAAALTHERHATGSALAVQRAVGIAAGVGQRNGERLATAGTDLLDAVAPTAGPGCRVPISALMRAVDTARPVGAGDLAAAHFAGASGRASCSPAVLGRAATAPRPPADALATVQTRHIHKVILLRVVDVQRAPYCGPVYDFTVPPDATFWADGMLVHNCSECIAVDGTEYPDLASAMQDYAAGGYVDCAGGPRCRGTIIAVGQEVNPLDPSAPPDLVLDVGTG
jgi:hypothetical protein